MNQKFKLTLLLILVGFQIVFNRYHSILQFNIDFLYLVIVFYSIKSDYYKCIIFATIIGLVADLFSTNILGVFGFSRTLIAFLLFNFSKFIDFRRTNFLFFYVFISLSLSNFIANSFFYLINNIKLNFKLIILTPFLTACFAVLLLSIRKIREKLNVY